jgi:hypothetical protein
VIYFCVVLIEFKIWIWKHKTEIKTKQEEKGKKIKQDLGPTVPQSGLTPLPPAQAHGPTLPSPRAAR